MGDGWDGGGGETGGRWVGRGGGDEGSTWVSISYVTYIFLNFFLNFLSKKFIYVALADPNGLPLAADPNFSFLAGRQASGIFYFCFFSFLFLHIWHFWHFCHF